MSGSIDQRIDGLLREAPFNRSPEERSAQLLPLLRDQVEQAASAIDGYGRYVASWPVPLADASSVAELPYLPVSALKRNPPLAMVPLDQAQRLLRSSGTSGQQPSRVLVDRGTAKRMTRGTITILKDFIGVARRPMLVVDAPETYGAGLGLGARGAAIRGLQPFASSTTPCLIGADALDLDEGALRSFGADHGAGPVLIYGFTWVLWKRLVERLDTAGVRLGMQDTYVLHSGGWKALIAEAVHKQRFNETTARVFGCPPERVLDFYGMVEHVGVVYPDCAEGNKHAPVFADVIIRDPTTLLPVTEGQTGLIQVCSVLPTSFPGHLLLTDDLGTVVHLDGCPCGRRGLSFVFAGRAPRAELRGCGDVAARRQR